MAKVENLQRVIKVFRDHGAKSAKEANVSVPVSFSAKYAIFVHEDLTARHTNGQAKFLEQPARENARVYQNIILKALRQGLPLSQSLLLAGLRLQRDAQALTPVDTGALRASAFTRIT